MIYDRIYYTIFRGIHWLANIFSMTSDLPRTRVALILALINGINFWSILGIVSAILGKRIIIDSPLQILIAAGIVIASTFFYLFHKQRYKKIETTLSTSWSEDKTKNIFLTLAYLIISIILVWLSIKFIRNL